MARKLPRLVHVKYVHRRGKVYAYFNTGQKTAKGHPIRVRMPDPSSAGFFDSYAALKAGRTKRAAVAYTVADMASDYLTSGEFSRKAANTQKAYRSATAKIVDEWGRFPAADLQPRDVRLAIESGKWGAATCNAILAQLGVLFRWGRRNDKTACHPAKDIGRQETGQHEPWPEDILDAALASKDDAVRLGAHLLYFTGQRIGDVCAMRWGDIRDGCITVKQGKTGKTVEPPISRDLQVELDRTPRTDLLVMAGMSEGRLRRKLQAFTRSLGVATVPHGLRKNAVNALLEAGCTVPEVSAITGQTHQIVEHYAARVNRRKLGRTAVLKFDAARKRNG